MSSAEKAKKLKETANKHLQDGKHAEAMLNYTHAIRLTPNDHLLYSNRSLSFLRMHQYYYAHEDAKEAIKIKPEWAKGHYRKGEVELETGHYDEALNSFREALQYDQTNDFAIPQAIKKAKVNFQKEMARDHQFPWVAAGLGVVIGMTLCVGDFMFFRSQGFVANPILKLMVIAFLGIIFFQGSRFHRNYLKEYKASLLRPPVDIFEAN